MMTPRPNARLSSQAMAFVLAGGRGSRLKELTDRRAKPAVYFGGKTRIIDFALSNALNSGIRKMAIATQYKAHSLIRHCQRGWNFFRAERNEYLDILPASQRVDETKWYLGTADAVAQNIDIVDSYNVKYVIILAGDHVYKMDYEIMLAQHVETGADVTIGCLTVPRAEATAFGVMAVDAKSVITDFVEKPEDPPAIPGDPEHSLASMGIYVFNTQFLLRRLEQNARDPTSAHDFGKNIIPRMVESDKTFAYPFSGYWVDVGTIAAYLETNLALLEENRELRRELANQFLASQTARVRAHELLLRLAEVGPPRQERRGQPGRHRRHLKLVHQLRHVPQRSRLAGVAGLAAEAGLFVEWLQPSHVERRRRRCVAAHLVQRRGGRHADG